MNMVTSWSERESRVHVPGLWLPYSAGAVFTLVGVAGLVGFGVMWPDVPRWLPVLFFGGFLLAGVVSLAMALRAAFRPVYVRHAAEDVLPEVPREPVMYEGAVVQALSHELVQTDAGWTLRPSRRLRHTGFLLGFGIPFLVGMSAVLTWVLHDWIAHWLLATVPAVIAISLTGGTALLLVGMLARANYRRATTMLIPTAGGDVELQTVQTPDWLDDADLAKAFEYFFQGGTKRNHLTIPRQSIAAVQLRPWKITIGDSTTWAVQSLLVLASPEGYRRLPLMLVGTGEIGRAAQLAEKLAEILHVPYLFGADAAGWEAELRRARRRPPLRVGGM